MNRIIIIPYFVLLSTFSLGQLAKIDSLENKLKNELEDTTYVNILNELSEKLSETDKMHKASEYAKEALERSQKLNYKKGIVNAHNNMGVVYYYDENIEKATEHFKQAFLLATKMNLKKEIADGYNNSALIEEYSENYKTAYQFYKNALSVYQELQNRRSIAITLSNIGMLFERQNKLDTAIENLLTSLNIYKELNEKNGIAMVSLQIAGIYYNLSSYEKAIEFSEQALKIYDKTNNKEAEMECLMSLGNNYEDLGNFDEAVDYYFRARKIAEELEDTNAISEYQFNMAGIYYELGLYDQAIENTMGVIKVITDSVDIGKCYNLLGMIYLAQEKYAIAKEYYLKGLAIAKKFDSKYEIGTNLNGLATVYSEQEEYEEALIYYKQALNAVEELDDKIGIAATLLNIGGVCYENSHEKAEYNNCIEYLNRSLDLSKKIGAKSVMLDAYWYLVLVYSELKDPDTSIEYFYLYDEMKDSIFNQESSNKIANIQSRYEIEKKQKEIELLNKERELLNKDKELQTLEIGKKDAELTNQQLKIIASKFESEKRQKEIELLSADKELQAAVIAKKEVEIKNQQVEKVAAKFQTEKKQKEIKLLKSERLLKEGQLNTQKIIIWASSAGLMLFFFIAFFIFRAYKQKQKANIEISDQKKIIEEKNKDITDSIRYAQRIQEALLTSSEYCRQILPEHFILFKPKDIVSGDYYWAYSLRKDTAIWMNADCTGHGVPGAFMSMIGINLLNEIVIEKGVLSSEKILNEMRNRIIKAFGQTGATGETRDGMDAAICIWHKDTDQIEFSGANNPLYILRNNIIKSKITQMENVKFHGDNLAEIKADRQPIGFEDGKNESFTKHLIQVEKGDSLYTFSDGYADQFGGQKDKKFSYKRFKELLISIQDKSMSEQKEILDKTIEDWKADVEQIDDICVIGVRIT